MRTHNILGLLTVFGFRFRNIWKSRYLACFRTFWGLAERFMRMLVVMDVTGGIPASTLFHDAGVRLMAGDVLVTTAWCWLPGRCWSGQYASILSRFILWIVWKQYLQHRVSISIGVRRYNINSGRFRYLVSGIRNSVFGFEIRLLEPGIRFEVFERVWSHCGTACSTLSPVHCAGKMLISQGMYWLRREGIDCVSEWMSNNVPSRRIVYRAERMLSGSCSKIDHDDSFTMLGVPAIQRVCNCITPRGKFARWLPCATLFYGDFMAW